MAEDGVADRRIQDAAAIAAMTVQIGNLAAAMIRVESAVAQLLQRLEAAEQRAHDNCRECESWTRLRVLEDFKAGADERMKVIADHEQRLRWIEPRMAAAAAIFSTIAFIAGKVWK